MELAHVIWEYSPIETLFPITKFGLWDLIGQVSSTQYLCIDESVPIVIFSGWIIDWHEANRLRSPNSLNLAWFREVANPRLNE